MKINGNDVIWNYNSYVATSEGSKYYIWEQYGTKFKLIGMALGNKEFIAVIKMLEEGYDRDFKGELH